MYISKYMDFEDFISVKDFSVLQFEKVIQNSMLQDTVTVWVIDVA